MITSNSEGWVTQNIHPVEALGVSQGVVFDRRSIGISETMLSLEPMTSFTYRFEFRGDLPPGLHLMLAFAALRHRSGGGYCLPAWGISYCGLYHLFQHTPGRAFV